MRPEEHHARQECPEVERWSAPDVMASEVEVSSFLASLVHLLKPDLVVEAGTYHGDTAEAIARALLRERRGSLVTIEVNDELAGLAAQRLEQWSHVAVLHRDALLVATAEPIDLLFVDTADYRMEQIEHFKQFASVRCVIVCHDTQSESLRRELNLLHTKGVTEPWLFLPTPRGLGLSRYR